MSSDDPSRRDFLVASTLTAASLTGTVGPLSTARAAGSATVPAALVQRVKDHGVDTLIGVPGATCASLFSAADAAGMRIVVTSGDLEAGYAADGYARLRGLSLLSVSYGVGTLGLVSVIAGAHAERVPILLVNGGPTPKDERLEAELGTLYSHSCGRVRADLEVFREVTEAALRIEDARSAPDAIDRAIATALSRRRPVYLEIPKHLGWAQCTVREGSLFPQPSSRPDDAAIGSRILGRLRDGGRGIVLVGVEVQRLGLQDALQTFLTRSGLPWATTPLAKSTLDERLPGFVGVYCGARSVPSVKAAVEEGTPVLALGTVMGRQQRSLVEAGAASGRLLRVEDGTFRDGGEQPVPASLRGVLEALGSTGRIASSVGGVLGDDRSFAARRTSVVAKAPSPVTRVEEGLHYEQVLQAVSDRLDDTMVAVTDTSLSMYPAGELAIRGRDAFVCNGVWQSIGFSVAAALGVGLAGPRRPVVICGDGGFQMTSMALSTLARQGIPAIVVLLDNALYGIEQWLLRKAWFAESRPTDPLPYTTLHRWDYDAVGQGMGLVWARTVTDAAALDKALDDALTAEAPVLITVRIKPHDLPTELRA